MMFAALRLIQIASMSDGRPASRGNSRQAVTADRKYTRAIRTNYEIRIRYSDNNSSPNKGHMLRRIVKLGTYYTLSRSINTGSMHQVLNTEFYNNPTFYYGRPT